MLQEMTEQLARRWWVLAVRGVAGVLFGLSAMLWPGLDLIVLLSLFGAYALVDGIFALVAAAGAAFRRTSWWPLVLQGLAGIAAGVLAFGWPGLTALALVYLIAAWALVGGAGAIGTAIRLRKEIENEWLLALSGIVSVLFGLLLVVRPGAGALALVWTIGLYAVVFGVLLLGLAFRVRGLGRRIQSAAAPRAS